MAEDILHALPLAGDAHVGLGTGGDLPAIDGEVGKLRQREQTERHRDQRNAIEQIEPIKRPAQGPRLRAGPDHRDHQAESGRGQAFQWRTARQRRHHRQSEYAEGKQLRRTDRQHDRLQQRNGDSEHDSAKHAAERGRDESGAEGAAGLAPLRHRVTVQNRCRGPYSAGHPEQHRRYQVRYRSHCRDAKQQGEGGLRLHVVGERNQHRQGDHATQARHHPDGEPEEYAEHENRHAIQCEQRVQRLKRRVQLAFHRPSTPPKTRRILSRWAAYARRRTPMYDARYSMSEHSRVTVVQRAVMRPALSPPDRAS